MKLSKDELRYILASTIFALVWFFAIFPYLSERFANSSPYLLFLIFNVGVYVFLFIFLKSFVQSTKVNFKVATGLIALFIALDVFMPEYHVNSLGQLIEGGIMGKSASDYMFGFMAQSFGLQGPIVALFAYILAPLVLLIVSAFLLDDFVNKL